MLKKQKLKIIPLGGLEEIGKNFTVFEYGNDLIILDCGLAFPDDEMLGVDSVIPDFSYVLKNQNRIRGVVLTHGHEDHIGALPYFLKQMNVPVYGTRLTLGLVSHKLKEHDILADCTLRPVSAGETIRLGSFNVEFIHTNHSIPDAVAIALHTPVGVVVHTGDFKIDYTPIEGKMIDLGRFGELGNQGVLALMADSTNVERRGYTMSEKSVGYSFDEIFSNHTTQRIVVATFASNVHRIQQIVDAAQRYRRRIALSGRSMINVFNTAVELGYMKLPKGILIDIDNIDSIPPHQLVIITTGSQGEAMSALTRMAFSDHKKVNVGHGDTIIISANPIPGNEKSVSRVINELFKLGCEVIYEALADIHVSGHACREELKLVHSLLRPKFFIPVHGEYRHLMQHAHLAQELGMSKKNTFVMAIGQVLEMTENKAEVTGTVPAGKVLVDGLGVGDVGNIVLRDRKHLAQDGLIVVVITVSAESKQVISTPDIISRGFVYVRESETLMESIKTVALEAVEKALAKNQNDWSSLKMGVKNELGSFLYEKTKRKPMILPIVMEV